MKIYLRSIKQAIMLAAFLAAFTVSSAPNTPCHASQATTSVTQQRELFNEAIKNADLKSIASVLSDSVILVTGSGSDLLNGKQGQLDIWESGFKKGEERDVYQRTTDCVSISDLGSMAMEYGQWKGLRNDTILYSGIYTAKWRFNDASQSWLLEAEVFMTHFIK